MKNHRTYAAPAGQLEKKAADGVPDNVEIKKALDTFESTLNTFQQKVDQELAQLKKGGTADVITKEELKKLEDALGEQKKLVEGMRLDAARPIITSPDGTKTQMTADQVEHKKAFDRYFRKGDDNGLGELQVKTLSVGSDPDGGYTVPVQNEAAIDRVITEISPVRQVARIVTISTAEYKRLTSKGGASSGWVGEQETRSTTDTPQLAEQKYPTMELYAQPAATQSLLDDSAVNIEQWLADEVSIEFASQEGAAFVVGNGAAKPKGFLSYDKIENDSWSWGKTGYVATGVSGDFADSSSDPGAETENIVDLVYSLKPAFRANARFTMNRKTVSRLMKLRDAEGRQLWSSGLQAGQPDLLMGYPMLEMEDMPDIAANSYSIAFGDFRRGYIIVDRTGVRVLRDPYSSKPYVLFYTTKRVGGGMGHFDAIKLMKFAAS
jgi:HK97 family phage major capsid protein